MSGMLYMCVSGRHFLMRRAHTHFQLIEKWEAIELKSADDEETDFDFDTPRGVGECGTEAVVNLMNDPRTAEQQWRMEEAE